MDNWSRRSIRCIGEVTRHLDTIDIAHCLIGGWATDFHVGRVTRKHADIDFLIYAQDQQIISEQMICLGQVSLTPNGLRLSNDIGISFFCASAYSNCLQNSNLRRLTLMRVSAPVIAKSNLIAAKLSQISHESRDVFDLLNLKASHPEAK